MKLNEKIMISRKKRGMSQIDLADELGVSRQSVSKWETGESNPEINKLSQLARVLNVSVDWLLSEDDNDSVEEDKTLSSVQQVNAFPEWINHLPKFALGMIKKYGWLYGLFVSLGGVIFTLFGIIARVFSYNFIFGNSLSKSNLPQNFVPGFDSTLLGTDMYNGFEVFGEINNQAWAGFSAVTGIIIATGVVITAAGIVLAIVLYKWGKKNRIG